MYEIDEKDRVIFLEDLPQSSTGAPQPFVMADERLTILAYYLENRDPDWDGSYVRVLGPTNADEPLALVRFFSCRAHMFGPPNDEAFHGHPLASRGLEPYRAFRIEHSSWIRHLERMNSVHPRHRPESFEKLQHFIFAFHDSTFECVCKSYEIQTTRGAIASAVPEMLKLLAWE